MVDSKTVRDIYQSLRSGDNEFDFSHLQEALRQAGVDVENFDLTLKNDQQALLCVTEKFLLDSQNRETMMQQPVLLFDLPVTGLEGYWECWERLYNHSLASLYRKSQKVSFLDEKRELLYAE
ncbi:MAG: hypothetical protein AAFX80_00190 [Cyanobacteria bacterium J06639_18]